MHTGLPNTTASIATEEPFVITKPDLCIKLSTDWFSILRTLNKSLNSDSIEFNFKSGCGFKIHVLLLKNLLLLLYSSLITFIIC